MYILFGLYSIVTVFIINGDSLIINTLFLLLMLQSLYYLFGRGIVGFSIYKIYFIFSYIFMGYAPLLHYADSLVFWGAMQPSVGDYIITLFYLIVFNFIVGFSYNYNLLEKYRLSVYERNEPNHYNYHISNILIITCVTLVTFLSLYKNGFNLNSVFFRSVKNDDAIVFGNSLSLIIARFTSFFPMFALLIYSKFNKGKYICKTYLLLCLLLCAFPLSISRFAVAAIYLPICLFYFKRLMGGQLMTIGMIGSICIIFPFMEQFRYFNESSKVSFLPDPNFFYAAHFDAFQNTLSALNSGLITYGYQLLGSLFFYIPRTFWPDKPIGTGAQLAENLGYSFTNISMPFAAEAYINFGVLGGLTWALSLAYAMRKLDILYWTKSYKSDYFTMIYFFSIAFLTFILRGDLMSSFAYFMGGFFSFSLAKFIFEKGKVKT